MSEYGYLQEVLAGRKVATNVTWPNNSSATTAQADTGITATASVSEQAAQLIKMWPHGARPVDDTTANKPTGAAVIHMTPVEAPELPASQPSLDAVDHVALAR